MTDFACRTWGILENQYQADISQNSETSFASKKVEIEKQINI